MTKKLSGVYCIENIKSKKMYIGQTVDLNERKRKHLYKLMTNCHDNSHLQNAWNKYGEDSFKFNVLIYCESPELTKHEQFFVNTNTAERLYNIRKICVDSNYGLVHSKKSIERMSGENNHNYGKPIPLKVLKKMSEAQSGNKNHMYGKSHTTETKNKISRALKGESCYWYGKHLSEETKIKLSTSHKGKHLSEEAKIKISLAQKGRILSLESRKKLSEERLGDKNPSSKLHEKDVLNIYKLLKEKTFSAKTIANIYNVSEMTIYSIKTGKRWHYLYSVFLEGGC